MNPHLQRPMKTLLLLHGYSGSCSDWMNMSLIIDLVNKYNLAVICPTGENSFYLDGKDGGYFRRRVIYGRLRGTSQRFGIQSYLFQNSSGKWSDIHLSRKQRILKILEIYRLTGNKYHDKFLLIPIIYLCINLKRR